MRLRCCLLSLGVFSLGSRKRESLDYVRWFERLRQRGPGGKGREGGWRDKAWYSQALHLLLLLWDTASPSWAVSTASCPLHCEENDILARQSLSNVVNI